MIVSNCTDGNQNSSLASQIQNLNIFSSVYLMTQTLKRCLRPCCIPDDMDVAAHIQFRREDGLVQGEKDVSADVLLLEDLLILRQVHRIEKTLDL